MLYAVKLLCSLQPNIESTATPDTLAKMAMAEAFQAHPEHGIRGPERFDEHMFYGLHLKANGRRAGYLAGGSSGGAEAGWLVAVCMAHLLHEK